ncbi:FAD binding domain-containing protein [Sinomonas sp. JGH33]|uniref:FAD binding domain-containing protein n=1 Tax=Sinomonas terricola TaxID=3110330 RepID=A0ABU5T2L2_9MICC|nr:FAD binding domain-containing protein [Sinomonas sp. JGH33]MEA5453894.1 FAD binding domain-containing protein [Sinomonas sp. JGH33]
MDMNTIEALVPTADPADWRDGDAWLAGGTVLFSYGSQTLRRLLDLTSAGWEPVEEDDGGMTLASTCTIARLWELGDPAGETVARWPGLAVVRACCDAFVASFKIWNLSTVGGNIATALPAGPMTSLCAGLDGFATLWDKAGGRELPVAELVTGDGRNALAPGELIRSIRLPAHALLARTAFRRLSLSNLGRSGVLLIGRLDPDGGFVLTVTASTKRPVQLRFAAAGLPDAEGLAEAIDAAIPGHLYHDDIHGLPAWRRDMTYRLAEELRVELVEGGA